jgi:hypothetical protein
MLQKVLMEGGWAVLLAGVASIGIIVAAQARNWGWAAFLGVLFLFTQAVLLWTITQILAVV